MTATALALALSATGAPASAAPCPAAAALEGPADVTAPIAKTLRAHGVAIGTGGGCAGRTVRATLTPVASAYGFKLHIEDAFGRTSDRVIAEPGMAVSLIESWAVDEDADLLTGGPAAPPAEAALAVTAAPAWVASPFYLYGGLASAVGSDSSLWAGGALAACGRVGALCVGGKARLLRDTSLRGPAAEAGTSRTGAAVVVTVGLPLTHGRLLLMPSLGAGAGWLRTHVAAEDAETPAATDSTLGLRGEAALLAGVALARHAMLALEVGGTFAPGARPAPPPEQTTAVSLPGEPKGSFEATLAYVWAP